MDISALKHDYSKSEAGRWVGEIPEMGDLELRVRGLKSTLYEVTLSKKIRALPRNEKDASGQPKPEALRRVVGETYAEVILLEWRGLTKDGKAFKYDPKIAREWLINADYRAFLDAVHFAATTVDNDREDVAEVMEKN